MPVGPIPHSPRMHLFVCVCGRVNKFVFAYERGTSLSAKPLQHLSRMLPSLSKIHGNFMDQQSSKPAAGCVYSRFGSSSSCDIASKLNDEKESQMEIPFSCRASPRFNGSKTVRRIPNANPFVFFFFFVFTLLCFLACHQFPASLASTSRFKFMLESARISYDSLILCSECTNKIHAVASCSSADSSQ